MFSFSKERSEAWVGLGGERKFPGTGAAFPLAKRAEDSALRRRAPAVDAQGGRGISGRTGAFSKLDMFL